MAGSGAGTLLVKRNVIPLCRRTVCLQGGTPCGAFPKICELEHKASYLGKYFASEFGPFACFAGSSPCQPAFLCRKQRSLWQWFGSTRRTEEQRNRNVSKTINETYLRCACQGCSLPKQPEVCVRCEGCTGSWASRREEKAVVKSCTTHGE